MKRHNPDGIVTVEGRGGRSLLHWLTDHLAQHPGWVTLITFLAGVVVTWLVLAVDERLNATDVITTLAALWALFFGVMIYLLSAEDTDHILSQISDLQGQLSTALASPDGEDSANEPALEPAAAAEADNGSSAGEPIPEANPSTPDEPVATEPADQIGSSEPTPLNPAQNPAAGVPSLVPAERQRSTRGEHQRLREPRQRNERHVQILTTPDEITQGLPPDWLSGWSQATGLPTSAVTRAWTRDPAGHQWVLDADSARWLVFSRHNRGIGIVPLRPDPPPPPPPPPGGYSTDRRSRQRETRPR